MKSLCDKYSKVFQEKMGNLIQNNKDDSTEKNAITGFATIINNSTTFCVGLL